MTALVVAVLSWASWGGAAGRSVLPPNSVGTKQLRNGAVTAAKVRSHTLVASDFKPGQLPKGPRGPEGPPGEVGPSEAFTAFALGPTPISVGGSPAAVAELRIPQAGDYVISATAYFVSSGSGIASATCTLDTLEGEADQTQFLAGNPTPVALSIAHVYAGIGSVELACESRAPVDAHSVRITAIRVGSLQTTGRG